MKSVLIVAFDFPPQGGTGAIRVTKFAKYLPEFGWQPVVVTSDMLWNRDESLAQDVPPDTPVYRVGWPKWVQALRPAPPQPHMPATITAARAACSSSLKTMGMQLARRLLVPDSTVLWVRNAQRACAQALRVHPCDVILTSSPPNTMHLVGQWVHSHFGTPWIADFRDVWTAENPSLRELGGLNFTRQRCLEQRVLQRCSRAVMVTEPLAQRTLDVFGTQLADKISVITNGFDPEDFNGTPAALDNDVFTITYLGTMVGPWMANAFPEGIRYAVTHSDLFRQYGRVRFIGELGTAYRARLAGLEANVEISNYVPHATAIEMMRHSHVLVLTLSDTQLASMTFTNKFFEYLAARRPILAIVPPGLIQKVVEEEQLGWVAPPNAPQVIGQTLLTLFDSLRNNPNIRTSSDMLLARFNRRELTRCLAEILNQQVSR